MALTSKRETKKAKKQAEKTADAAGATALKAEKAVEELQKLAATIGPVVSEGAREARTRATELYDQYAPEAQQRLREQSDKFREQSDKFTSNLSPRADKLRHDVQEDYLPRARKTVETSGTVLKAAVDAARKELDKGQGEIRSAVLEPTPQPKKKGRAGRVLLIVGLAAAGAAAGYIAWQKTRPVEDPWAPPADFARAHYPASAGDESDSSTVSDTVGSADAGDVASALKGENTSDTEPKEVKVDSDPEAAEDDEKRGSHRSDS